MIDEDRLRRRLQRAIGYEPPDPSFGMQRISRLAAADADTRDGQRQPLALVLVAALLALAIVATLVLVGQSLRSEQLVPEKPGPIRNVATSQPIRVDAPTVMDCPAHCWVPAALTQVSPEVIWAIVDPSPSYRNGGPSNIFRTEDGGQHWKAQASWDNPTSSPTFTTTDSAWRPTEHMKVSADGAEASFVTPWGQLGASILHTTDSGAHWASFGFPVSAEPTHVCPDNLCDQGWVLGLQTFFLNTREGWLVSKGSVANTDDVYRTTDSGAHWILFATVANRGEFDLLHGQLEFVSSSAGWFVPDYAGDSSVARTVFNTDDGGATWQAKTLAALPVKQIEIKPHMYMAVEAAILGVRFFNEREGVIETQSLYTCGQNGRIPVFCTYNSGVTYVYTTSDGGSVWSPPRLIPGPQAIDYVDFDHWVDWGWAPYTFAMVRTSDGGKNWVRVENSAGFRSMDFVDLSDGLAWSGGCPANAFMTHDGGLHWALLNLPFEQQRSEGCI